MNFVRKKNNNTNNSVQNSSFQIVRLLIQKTNNLVNYQSQINRSSSKSSNYNSNYFKSNLNESNSIVNQYQNYSQSKNKKKQKQHTSEALLKNKNKKQYVNFPKIQQIKSEQEKKSCEQSITLMKPRFKKSIFFKKQEIPYSENNNLNKTIHRDRQLERIKSKIKCKNKQLKDNLKINVKTEGNSKYLITNQGWPKQITQDDWSSMDIMSGRNHN